MRRNFISAVVAIGIVCLIFSVAISLTRPRTSMQDVECYANPSGFLWHDGYVRVLDVDRQRIAALVGKGEAEIKLEQSLICHDFRDGMGMARVVVKEVWWRPKHPEGSK